MPIEEEEEFERLFNNSHPLHGEYPVCCCNNTSAYVLVVGIYVRMCECIQ